MLKSFWRGCDVIPCALRFVYFSSSAQPYSTNFEWNRAYFLHRRSLEPTKKLFWNVEGNVGMKHSDEIQHWMAQESGSLLLLLLPNVKPNINDCNQELVDWGFLLIHSNRIFHLPDYWAYGTQWLKQYVCAFWSRGCGIKSRRGMCIFNLLYLCSSAFLILVPQEGAQILIFR